MKLRKNRRGFTIVELVIVVAVIGVLAAVLIPTFINLTNKANKASDNSLVANLNTALAGREGETDDTANHTMQDAIDDLEVWGYKLENLTTKSKEKLLWNEKTNRFVLEDAKEVKDSTTKEQFWKIVKSTSEMESYSGYAHSLFNLGSGENKGKIEVSAGFDVGKITSFKTITYNNSNGSAKKDVSIRTNGGTLIVNGYVKNDNNKIGDTVNHYGNGLLLNITKMPTESYHEYGYFPKATIEQGRIVVEDEGEIPSVEVTSTNPVEIETNKSIAVSVSASDANNVSVTVTGEDAEVALDGNIDYSKVTVNGETATEETTTRITKVSNYSEFSTALGAQKQYIMFTDDISYATNGTGLLNVNYNTTIDGDGHTLSGWGKRGGNAIKTTLAINNGGTQMVDVSLTNLVITNAGAGGRPVETRGNIGSLSISNCDLRCTGTSDYMQVLTIGGSQQTRAKISIKHSSLYSPVYYGIITFNPVDLLVDDTTFECWAALYMKSPNSSAGSRGSKVTINNSKLICQNNNSGDTNDFGAIVFEDGSIDVFVKNTFIDVTENGDASQSAVVFSSGWAALFGTTLKEVNVKFENVTIKGTINDENIEYDSTNMVIIQSGSTTNDPSAYLADGSTVTNDGLFYIIQDRGTVSE